jgi:hypothetical protein
MYIPPIPNVDIFEAKDCDVFPNTKMVQVQLLTPFEDFIFLSGPDEPMRAFGREIKTNRLVSLIYNEHPNEDEGEHGLSFGAGSEENFSDLEWENARKILSYVS